MLSLWYYLDQGLNAIANLLFFKYQIRWLADRCQSYVYNSPKDKQIFQGIDITPFERKVFDNEAYRENYIPNNEAILETPLDSDDVAKRELFLMLTCVNLNDLQWNMAEMIELKNFKQDKEKLDRIYKIVNAYHKQHFLMSIGVIKC